MSFAFHAPTPDLLTQTSDGLEVNVRLPASLTVEAAWVRSEPDNEATYSALRPAETDDHWQTWRGSLKFNTAEDVTRYAFKVLAGGQQFWLSEAGITPFEPERDVHYRFNPYYRPAEWVWSQVFYQIFPDRFHDGDPSNNVRTGEYLYEGREVVAKQWGELPEKHQGWLEFYGGDLKGILEKLDYLQDLGITALYLNPIFTSPSSHKYDTVNYYQIDPHFGTNEDFANLCSELKKRDMRVILDAVINHTSERHPWFDRNNEVGGGAYHSAEADTRDFYVFHSDDPESYHGWYGVKTLPVLDYASERLQDLMFRNDDAVLRTWLREPYAIDGWRFDVLHMLGEGVGAKNNATYARHFRQTLREENREAYFLGEHFFEASKWLQGDQEDAAMNYYGFAKPVTEFLARLDYRSHPVDIDASHLDYLLMRARSRVPFAIQLSQFNLLDSHDTPRMLTRLGGDLDLMNIAVTLLFTYIGVPCVYYGDEVGLEGAGDPDCRRTFPWDEREWNTNLREHYRKLTALRRDTPSLQRGAFQTLYAEGDVFAFARVLASQAVITVVNRGEAQTVSLPVWKAGVHEGGLENVLGNDMPEVVEGGLELELGAKSSFVFRT